MVYKEHQDLKFKLIYKVISAFVRIHLCKSFITHSEIKIVRQQYQWISGSVYPMGLDFVLMSSCQILFLMGIQAFHGTVKFC